mmetsp:Transcript_3597/g.4839  ORF Transcript_3597/g.4839 Transcript_3597/m.4839 type:complete len:368 (+) Transcript_3597:17-1120(+)
MQSHNGGGPLVDSILTSRAPSGFYNQPTDQFAKGSSLFSKARWKILAVSTLVAAAIVVLVFAAGDTFGSVDSPAGNNQNGTNCGRNFKADVLWVLDQSGSVGKDNVREMHKAIYNFSEQLLLDASNAVRFGVVPFSAGYTYVGNTQSAYKEFPRDFTGDLEQWEDNIITSQNVFLGGQTNIADTLKWLDDVYFANPQNKRDDIEELFLIFIGDGGATLPFCLNGSDYINTTNGEFDRDAFIATCRTDFGINPCQKVREGYTFFGHPGCVNYFWEDETTSPLDASIKALQNLRAPLVAGTRTNIPDFKFYFLAVQGETNGNEVYLSDIFGNFETNPFNTYKDGDKVFNFSNFEGLFDSLSNDFQLECS